LRESKLTFFLEINIFFDEDDKIPTLLVIFLAVFLALLLCVLMEKIDGKISQLFTIEDGERVF
jgi:hypothetical protein